MDDPLLSSLCTICHIRVPKYTCPRCLVQTCSLACSKRHKSWASCNGMRDPTVFKPMSELATSSGIDQDYNFLHSIEHGIERSEKAIVEDRGLLEKKELLEARMGSRYDGRPSYLDSERGEECIKFMLNHMRTRVHKAPKGMKRNVENKTSWSRNTKTIKWQVEWIRQDQTPKRDLSLVMGKQSMEWHYDQWCNTNMRMNMSAEAKHTKKKRKAGEMKEKQAKKARMERNGHLDLTTVPRLQDPHTGAWTKTAMSLQGSNTTSWSPETYTRVYNHHLYLHRPLTPSSFPKVLVPIDTKLSLTEILHKRDVLEFPTIYVFENGPKHLPKEFILEEDFLKAARKAAPKYVGTDVSESSGEDSEDDTSHSETGEADSEADSLEEGEIEV